MKDFHKNNSTQCSISSNNMKEKNSLTNYQTSSKKTQNLSLFSSYLQKIGEVVEFDEKVKSAGCSIPSEVSSGEIKESLLCAFNFLRENSNCNINGDELRKKINPSGRHIRVGNCLTVYSNLDTAPIQEPFRKTLSEDLPVYIKNLIKTDSSLSHLLKYGCISISPVKNKDVDSEKLQKFQGGPAGSYETGCAGMLVRLKQEASKAGSGNFVDDTDIDLKKIFPEVFCALPVKSKRTKQPYLSYSRGVTIANDASISFMGNDESHFESNINPSDLLEVCIQEEESKSIHHATKSSDSRCSICRKYFATPIEMYLHVLTHSKSGDSKHSDYRSTVYNANSNALTIIKTSASTVKNTDSYKGGLRRRAQKLKSILKDINYDKNIEGLNLETPVNILNSNSNSTSSFQNKNTKKQNSHRSVEMPKRVNVSRVVGIRKKLFLKSSYRVQLNRNIKSMVNKAIYGLRRRNS